MEYFLQTPAWADVLTSLGRTVHQQSGPGWSFLAVEEKNPAGKVLYVGISDTPAWIVAQANTLADLRGWSRFVSMQAPYNLLERELVAAGDAAVGRCE